MRSQLSLYAISLSMGMLPMLSASLYGQEPGSGKVSENLREISRDHMKDPFLWPSIWKLAPQSGDPGGLHSWQNTHPSQNQPGLESPDKQPSKRKNEWKDSEERRTRNYLKKVGPLMPSSIYLPVKGLDSDAANSGTRAITKHYLAQNIVLTTPFLAEARSGAYFPRECKMKYNGTNESEILQLFDEVVLAVGREAGVKQGDLFRTYEVGSAYRTYASGRKLGRLVETNGIVEILRVGEKSSVARLVKCFGTIARDSRASPLAPSPEISATGYVPATDGKLAAQVVWVTEQQQFPQPYSYAIVDRGVAKGYRAGDMVLFLNRTEGRMTDKVLGNGIVVSVQERSATILIRDLLPGIINRGDYSVVIQSAVM